MNAIDVVSQIGIGDGQHGVGQIDGFFEFEGEVGVCQNRCNFFHAFQSFHPALSLFGLAGLGFKAVNEFLQMRNFVLLL